MLQVLAFTEHLPHIGHGASKNIESCAMEPACSVTNLCVEQSSVERGFDFTHKLGNLGASPMHIDGGATRATSTHNHKEEHRSLDIGADEHNHVQIAVRVLTSERQAQHSEHVFR
jgi:hypothetical protein